MMCGIVNCIHHKNRPSVTQCPILWVLAKDTTYLHYIFMRRILSSHQLEPQINHLRQAFGDHSADVDATSTAEGGRLRRLGRVGGVNDFLTGPLAERYRCHQQQTGTLF